MTKKKILLELEFKKPYDRKLLIGTYSNIPFISIVGSGRVQGTRVFLDRQQLYQIVDKLIDIRNTPEIISFSDGNGCLKLIGEGCTCKKCGSWSEQNKKKLEKKGLATEFCQECREIMPIGHKHHYHACMTAKKHDSWGSCPLSGSKKD